MAKKRLRVGVFELRMRRPVVSYLHDIYRVSERRAGRVARVPVSTLRYGACRSRGRHCGCGFGKPLKLGAVTATEKSERLYTVKAGKSAKNWCIAFTERKV
jgi:hypothetical protein